MIYLRWWCWPPRRCWWVVDNDGTLVWDFWTARAARHAADRHNAHAVASGYRTRYNVRRAP